MWKAYIYYILTVFFLLTQMFPPLNMYVPFGAAERIAVFLIGTFILFPSLLLKRSILLLLIYGLITYFLHVSGNAYYDTINSVVIPFICMMSGLILFEYANTYDKDYRFTKMVVLVTLSLNIIMALISIPQLRLNPNIIREYAYYMDSGTLEEKQMFNWLTSYATLHGLPFLVAPMVYLCRKSLKHNKKVFVSMLVFIIVFILLFFMSNATTAAILSIIMLLISILLPFDRIKRNDIVKIVFFAIFSLAILSPSISLPVINFTKELMNPEGVAFKRVEDIESSIIYGESEGDLGKREDLYATSRGLFFDSPIIGTSHPEQISRHTWIWDHLACLGIVFAIPLLLLFITHIKSVFKSLKDVKAPYIYGVLAYLLMLLFKNDFGTGTWLYSFGILPLFCKYIDYYSMSNSIKK